MPATTKAYVQNMTGAQVTGIRVLPRRLKAVPTLFTWHSLTSNGEVLLKIDDRALYDAFVADWTRIREMAAASTR